MIHLGNANPEVCVVGRCSFSSGMGSITYVFCELLSRSFATCILPTEPELRGRGHSSITLPNGRVIPIYDGRSELKASIFVDVLWNGSYDYNYGLVPQSGLRIAYPCLDSDAIPSRWVEILNAQFDVAAVASPHLEQVLLESGVDIPIATVPLAVDLDALLTRAARKPTPVFRIGSVAAFHRRKGTETLLEAFAAAFGDDPKIELVLHSNLVIPEVFEKLEAQASMLNISNVKISTSALSVKDKNDLLHSFDLFANFSIGEGFSIGPREALALGTPVVLSDVGGHSHLGGVPGVFLVRPTRTVPARYPEIDNMVVGRQRAVTVTAAAAALREAYAWAQTDERQRTISERRALASSFSFRELSAGYAELIKPELAYRTRTQQRSQFLSIGSKVQDIARKKMAQVGSWKNTSRVIVPAHDGGFFSLFNAFFSNMVWNLKEDRVHSTLPDWHIGRFLDRQAGRPPVSFCYGRPEDGNLWTKLFQPLFGLSESEMDEEASLYRNSTLVDDLFNYKREPLLTYIHAYKLYQSAWFKQMRIQYNNVLKEQIKLQPHIQSAVNDFVSENFNRDYVIAAHVRHPSHSMEQPEKAMAHTDMYINRIFDLAEQKGFSKNSDAWRVFVATDQDSVTLRFKEFFGERLCFVNDVRRTSVSEDAKFESLSDEEKSKEGHQIQHLVASNPNNWSSRMAEEVIKDAYIMARCDALVHVVSNVSTAISYINPDVEMIYCSS